MLENEDDEAFFSFLTNISLTSESTLERLGSFLKVFVKKYFENIEDVLEVHDLHIWAMSSTETALSIHITVKNKHFANNQYQEISHFLKEKFKIHHPTIQVELYDQFFECELKSQDVL